MHSTPSVNDAREPWYSRLARSVLDTSGPTALVALGLVGFLAWAVWGQIAVVQAKLDAIHNEVVTAKASMRAFAETQNGWNEKRESLLEAQTRLLRQICAQAADTKEGIRRCMDE